VRGVQRMRRRAELPASGRDAISGVGLRALRTALYAATKQMRYAGDEVAMLLRQSRHGGLS
jgi:hypothetical protein